MNKGKGEGDGRSNGDGDKDGEEVRAVENHERQKSGCMCPGMPRCSALCRQVLIN